MNGQFSYPTEQLDAEELQQIFYYQIRPYLNQLRSAGTGQIPRFVSVGGQPGSSKGRILETIASSTPGAVPVNGDNLRRFHPNYDWLMSEDPLRMHVITGQATGPWVAMSNEYLRQNQISAVTETTLRQPNVLLSEFTAFRDAGFSTELRVLAVPLAVSRAGILSRYVEQIKDMGSGHWTPGEHHDVAAVAVPQTVATLVSSGLVDRVVIQDRQHQVFHDAQVSAGGLVAAQKTAAKLDQARDIRNMPAHQGKAWLKYTEKTLADLIWIGENDPDVLQVAARLATKDVAAVVLQAYPDDQQTQQHVLDDFASQAQSLSLHNDVEDIQ